MKKVTLLEMVRLFLAPGFGVVDDIILQGCFSMQSVSGKLNGPGAPKSSSDARISTICAGASSLLGSRQGPPPQSVTRHFYISADEFQSPLGCLKKIIEKYIYKYIFTNHINKNMHNVKLTIFTIFRCLVLWH